MNMGKLYEEDIGGLQADLDFLENESFFIQQIKKDRFQILLVFLPWKERNLYQKN